MWHPTPELRARWLRQYGKDRFTFEEAKEAQTFPEWWEFPQSKTKRWKWLGEAFPPRVAEYLFNRFLSGTGYVLLDLFAGIGGWGLGATWSGRFSKVVMVEVNPEKCLYLRRNFSKLGIEYEVLCTDVRKVGPMKVDVITASPPCEDLTVLKYFNYNPTDCGTVPLTIYTLEYVGRVNPALALYENVYRKLLVDILRKYGWAAVRFDMSGVIPQRRVRLLGYRTSGLEPN
jgi:site-specific DNA-cytosine methylase